MKHYTESSKKAILFIKYNDETLTGTVTYGVETAFSRLLLRERQNGREDEEETVSSYWVILKKAEENRI